MLVVLDELLEVDDEVELLDEVDDDEVEDAAGVSDFLGVASPEPLPLPDFSALTLPERESLR